MELVTALYKHTCAIYEEMHKRSKVNKEKERIFTGHYAQVFNEVGASMAYYTPVRTLLLSPASNPCITFYQRGNVAQPSEIRLNHPPPEEWAGFTQKDLTDETGAAILPRVERLEGDVDRLVAWRESIGEVNLSEALRDFESRLRELEIRELKDIGETEK